MIFLVNPDEGASVARKGRTASGRLKRGYTISKKTGRVVKAKGSRKSSRKSSRKRSSKRSRKRSTRRARDSRGRFVSKSRSRRRRSSGTRRKRSRKMAKRKRDARGRFVSTKRSSRKRSTRRRRRTYRRNPPMFGDVVGHATEGAIDAVQVMGGEVVARAVPGLFGLSGGAMGLAAQAATAIIVGELAMSFLGEEAGSMILAGGLAAPLRSIVVDLNVPYVSENLSAYPQLTALAAYPRQLGPGSGMAAFPTASYDVEYPQSA